MKSWKIVLFAASIWFFTAALLYAGETARPRGTNVQVSSEDTEQDSLETRVNRDSGKPTFFNSGSTSLGVNEDGDPNLRTRF